MFPKYFSIKKTILSLPESRPSKPLIAAFIIISFALPLLIVGPESFGEDGVIGSIFANSSSTFSHGAQVGILLVSVWTSLCFTAIALGIALLFCHLASFILKKFRIELAPWKLFNIYVYAKIWQALLSLILGCLIIFCASTVTWLNSETVFAAFRFIPAITFYLLFAYCGWLSAKRIPRV